MSAVWQDVQAWLSSPLRADWKTFFFLGDKSALISVSLLASLLLGAIALCLGIPDSNPRKRRTALLLGATSLALLLVSGAQGGGLLPQIVFWSLAILTVAAAAGTICSRSAVYAAIWFAASLLGTGGLFVLQDAQFLGIATIVVYAGAIVVTLLFVVMLAQPDGHDTYDRISWSRWAKPLSVFSVALLLLGLLGSLHDLRRTGLKAAAPTGALGQRSAGKLAAKTTKASVPQTGMSEAKAAVTQTDATAVPPAAPHMAQVGRELFGRHLLSVELAGTLLLAALVGAVAIVIQGRQHAPSGAGERT
ncbi:MAG: NADH-quinone oxidoreductase subunit J [Planctomycetota bacterium]